jgi:D-amino-acid dehydrogenase
MRMSGEVAVVGGGVVGASLAYEFAVAGASVVLVDSNRPGRASDAGAGIVSPETFADPDDEWCRFGLDASRHLRALVARLVEDDADPGADAFAVCGSLVVALAAHEDPWFREVFDLAERRAPGVAEVAVDEARRMFPPLGPIWRALHNPHGARVDGRRLAAVLRDAAVRRGARLMTGEVVDFERAGERVGALIVGDQAVGCDTVVLAAGAWSADLARRLGVEVPVSPTKGQIVHVALSPGARAADDFAHPGAVPDTASWPIVQPVLNFYLVPWPDGRIACGGTFEAEAGFDERPTAAGLRDLLRECVAVAPGLAEATFVEARVGLRPTSADDRPVLGPVPGLANVHACTGHGANGLLLGPYSAALVAGEVLGGAPAVPTAYRAARFTAG